ncbi:general stress protein [Paenibacillus eucommiae]|uniref:General stress protein 17M-like domain-containing protein n=1 Tax=Paenibacillus eucommiae TaxID=1355755 RepID=A0ABS4IN32_9BACL|nr:general stress protein [Paenibacillus eucommiae]MBP1988974.1 hypothetical protein [Paenibacillus eucommiae]
MSYSIVVADFEKDVKKAILQFKEAGFKPHQIHVLAYDNEQNKELLAQQCVSRIGMATMTMNQMQSDLFRSTGCELRSKLMSFGWSPTTVHYYEHELENGRIVVAVCHEDLVH